ncbi:uncharacterized protein HMPREF1541_05087 [Cyphellophora europaea CBS 101466]|uniref:Uncharacterized protein n=1 Tax=Cyphellophora europaea (strain CBS 101466) TaxID=1220924 RepID=W2RWI9_CYPE1|nr:uncharacterized protein HMPREF1541_05087 [Cyphellophora europaea CBS 101466]ETN40807.1 hypothetical protein HMPREF1541_05087 [Cyphellophora europaea CBS 101466]
MASLPPLDHNPSPRSYPPLAPSTSAPIDRHQEVHHIHDMSRSAERTPPEAGTNSPRSLRSAGNPKIIVKKEPPSSPIQPAARHRPRKLDLNTSSVTNGPATARPNGSAPGTGRDALNSLHDVGLACLSPGFQTHDPTMREQLQRSLSVRDQQRSIIEQRLLKSAKGDAHDVSRPGETPTTGKQGPSTKKRPPPGLSIVPPAAERFANERVIQSAPLNQTFTGRNDPPPPRQVSGQNPAHGTTIQQIPAIQTSNRLPPISDVFGANELHPGQTRPPFLHANSTPAHSHGPPLPSPSFPPQTAHPMSQHASAYERPREYRSAEDAVHEMTGGREDLQPRLVHYGGHQPPTPPSPSHRHNLTPHKYQPAPPVAGQRRSRNEYEADSSPPLGHGREPRLGPFGEGRDSPATQKAKKDEFLSLCSRAWDLFHS